MLRKRRERDRRRQDVAERTEPEIVMTTIGRALGIPTRPTTAFQSAHDTDRNRAIDKFYNATWFPISGIFIRVRFTLR